MAIPFIVGLPLSAVGQTPPPNPRPPAGRGLVIIAPRRFDAVLKPFDRVHYIPTLAVGRWPVSSPAEVTTLADKTIAFEKRVIAGGPGRPRLGLVNHEGFEDARDRLDRMAASMPRYWAIERRYYSDARRRSPRPPTEQEVVDLLNSGVDLVVHVGHGSDTTWQGCLSTRDLGKIKNADWYPPSIFFQGMKYMLFGDPSLQLPR
jgi:hypothetical protein